MFTIRKAWFRGLFPKTRYVLSWIIAVGAGFWAIYYAWFDAFKAEKRADGNSGHVTIDFVSQWLLGRMIIEWRGPTLYYRPAIQTMLEGAFPQADEEPKQEKHDVDNLMSWLMEGDDKSIPSTVGGPLYPPVQGLMFVPLSLFKPRVAYRIIQIINLLLAYVIGYLAMRISRGRIWWPVATVLVMIMPGYEAAINLGQNPVISLFFMVYGWRLALQDRPLLGGIVWGLLAFKPVWALAFLLVAILSGRWRMAFAMAGTGLALILATLPIVGWHSWLDWLAVGRLATDLYTFDDNWICLSRDLQGVVRRWFLSPRDPQSVLASSLSLALWLFAIVVWFGIALWRRRAMRSDHGAGTTFLMLGAWLTCFHFMYYDSLLAALPLLVLFTQPTGDPLIDGRDVIRNGIVPVKWYTKTVPYVFVPVLIVSNYLLTWLGGPYNFPSWDTMLLFVFWFWCGWRVIRHGRLLSQEEIEKHRLALVKS